MIPHQKVLRFSAISNLNPVCACTSSKVVSDAISINTNLPFLFSNTANSVINMSTAPLAVKGKLHASNNFFSTAPVFLFLAECSITTITLDPQATKSMAPPIPFTNFLGMIQFAISQV